MSEPSRLPASLPPRWFVRTFRVGQRAAYAVIRGRFGLRTATADRPGVMRRIRNGRVSRSGPPLTRSPTFRECKW